MHQSGSPHHLRDSPHSLWAVQTQDSNLWDSHYPYYLLREADASPSKSVKDDMKLKRHAQAVALRSRSQVPIPPAPQRFVKKVRFGFTASRGHVPSVTV